MKYKILGRSGLRVSEICLGTMTFGEEWAWASPKDESRKIFDIYANSGGNFIDTANRYTEGSSERFLGEFISSEREHFVLATKYSLFTQKGDPNKSGNHRKNMVQAVEASLKRLNTGYIDLYWVHAWDFTTPVEEVMRALDDLVRSGKILHIGISDSPAWIAAMGNTMAEFRNWTKFTALQIEYSLIQRSAERELLPMARAFDLAVTPWASLGGGFLSGKYTRNKVETNYAEKRIGSESKRLNEKNFLIADEVKKIADELNVKPVQAALNWVRQQGSNIIPIVGARKAEQLSENLQALNFTLSSEHIKRLDEVSKTDLGFPHDFLSSDNITDLLFGGTRDQIELIQRVR